MIFAGTLLLAVLALPPLSAHAQCPQWDVGGQWSMQQSDGLTVNVNLRQNGKTVTGTAVCYTTKDPTGVLAPFKGKDPHTLKGAVTGNLAGDDLYAEIQWSPNSTGIYRGKIGPQGRIEGSVYDTGASSKKMTWVSPTLMKCPGKISASTSRILSGIPMVPKTEPASAPSPKKLISHRGKGPTAVNAPVTAEPVAATSTKKVISSSGKGTTDAGAPAGGPKIKVFNKPGQAPGSMTATWDAGPDHPYAEVWVSVDGEDETKVVEQGKGTRQVSVEPGKTYRYILTDSGQELATVTVQGK